MRKVKKCLLAVIAVSLLMFSYAGVAQAASWQWRGWKDTTSPAVGINPGIRGGVQNPDGSLEVWGQGQAVYEGTGSPSDMYVHVTIHKLNSDGTTWTLLAGVWCDDNAPVATSKSNPYLCPSYAGDLWSPAGTIANPVSGTWKVVESVCINSTSNCNQATSPFFSQ